MRVLLVDGCPDHTDSLNKHLQTLGHETRAVATPRLAFVCALRFAPEVIMSELEFSGADSRTWLKKLRRHPALVDSRFIAITTRCDATTLRCARETGFEYVLVKPVDPFSLAEYLVGVSSPPWRQHAVLPHPWPVAVSGPPGIPRPLSAERLEEPPDREAVADFLLAMREITEQDARESGCLPEVPAVIPPVALLRYLEVIRTALQAARNGDRLLGHQLLHEGLVHLSAAPPQPWSGALSGRYHLALRTYCTLQHFGFPRPDCELP